MSGGRPPLGRSWLVEQYVDAGRSSLDLAEETGWSSQYVRDRLREAGIRLREPGGPKPDQLDPAVVGEWLAQGCSVAEIAGRSGYTPSGVYRLIESHSLGLPASMVRRLVEEPSEQPVVAECGRRYAVGQSLAVIGAAFGRGPDWARPRVVAAGVRLRSGGRPRADRVGSPERAVLVEAVAGGATVAQISECAGRAPDVVRGWLRDAGIELPQPRRKRVLPVLDSVVLRRRYVVDGQSIAAIAADLEVSSDRVLTGLKVAGIPRRPRYTVGGVEPVPIPVDLLRRLYVDQGRSAVEVAAQLQVNPKRVLVALRRHGITVRPAGESRRRAALLDVDAGTLRGLYVEQRLDDAAIAARWGVPTDRVRRRRRALGVYRDPVPPPAPPGPPDCPGRARLVELYVQEGRTLAQIAGEYHTRVQVVRGWMRAVSIPVRARTSRAHRFAFDVDQLRKLYVEREWPATAIAAELDTTVHLVLRALHDHDIPVRHSSDRRRRAGGPASRPGDGFRLLTDLYADPDVVALLASHHLPTRPQAGTISDRFPTPLPVSEGLFREAYLTLGLSARHIELLTGHPADQLLDALHAADIPVRAPGGPSPWLTRQLSNPA